MTQAWSDRVRRRLADANTVNPSRPKDRRAAVVLPILDAPDEPRLVGIVRTERGDHAGQFAMPGGMLEGDETPWEAAMREADEETGITRLEPLGELGEFNTWVSRFRVNAFVARLETEPAWRPQASEVEAVLSIPVRELVTLHEPLPDVDDVWDLPIECGYEFDPEPYRVAGRVPPRGDGHRLGEREMPFVWGLTARILYDFLRRVW